MCCFPFVWLTWTLIELNKLLKRFAELKINAPHSISNLSRYKSETVTSKIYMHQRVNRSYSYLFRSAVFGFVIVSVMVVAVVALCVIFGE